jgi:hypothetical protein
MSVDPNIDYSSHDPDDSEELSDDPRIRAAQELEAHIRRALATKENPLRDNESTAQRLRRSRSDTSADEADSDA